MKYMLDTNICIYLMNHNENVLKKFFAERNHGVSISTITLAELEFGIQNSAAQAKNRNKLSAFLPLVEIFSFDTEAAFHYGIIRAELERKGTPIGAMDTLIAAHAKSKELIMVTNNVREFDRIDGLKVENWV